MTSGCHTTHPKPIKMQIFKKFPIFIIFESSCLVPNFKNTNLINIINWSCMILLTFFYYIFIIFLLYTFKWQFLQNETINMKYTNFRLFEFKWFTYIITYNLLIWSWNIFIYSLYEFEFYENCWDLISKPNEEYVGILPAT